MNGLQKHQRMKHRIKRNNDNPSTTIQSNHFTFSIQSFLWASVSVPAGSMAVQCVSKPVFIATSISVDAVLSHFSPYPIPFSLMNGFGGDVIAEQPSHPCLVIHNTVCHVTPCVFLSSEPWLKQCSFKKCSLCLQNE